MFGDEAKTSGWLWLLTFLLIYFLGISLWVGTGQPKEALTESIVSEREHNLAWAEAVDASAWKRSQQEPVFGVIGETLAERIAASNNIVDGQKGVVEEVMDDTPIKLTLYSTLLDYRMHVILSFVPLLIIVFAAALIDGLSARKVLHYRNSFSSPLKHTIGGKVLGINLGVIIVLMFFAPIALPFWVFVLIVLLKIFGWWLWAVNLPKRM